MLTYLACGETTLQHKAGTNPTGTARRECQHCERTYTPAPQAALLSPGDASSGPQTFCDFISDLI